MPTTMRRYGASDDTAITEGPEPADRTASGDEGFTEHRNSSSTVAPTSPIEKGKSAPYPNFATQPALRTEEDVEQGIQALARQMSRQVSRAGTTGTAGAGNVFDYEPGSDLDPYSKTFDAKKWVRSLQRLAEEDDGTAQRTSGVAYKGMSVHGFGSDAGMYIPIVSFSNRASVGPR